jgi:hypothetical protein
MRTWTAFFALAFALACPAALSQEPDPLKSPECGQALAELQAARAQRTQDTAPVEQARKRAARLCLGLTEQAQPSGRVEQPPLRVPSPVITPAQRPALPAAPAIAPPEIRRPPVITSCDPGGCWDSYGTRLNRAGPNLIGPRGVCTQQGVILNCP